MATVTKALQEECFEGFYAEEEQEQAQATADDNDVSTPAYDIGDENPTAAAVSFSLMDKSTSSTVDESNDPKNLAEVIGDPIDSTNTNKRGLDDGAQIHNPFLQPKKKKRKSETKKCSGGTSGSGKHAAAASSGGSAGENVNHVNGDGNGAKGDGNENVSAASSGGSSGGQNEAAASSGDDLVSVPALPAMKEDDGYARADKQLFEQRGPKKKQIRPLCKIADCPMQACMKGRVCHTHFKNPNAPIKEKVEPGKKKKRTCKVAGCPMLGWKKGGVCQTHFNNPNAPIKEKPGKKAAEGQPAAKTLKTADDSSSSNAEDAGMEEAELMAAAAALRATQVALV